MFCYNCGKELPDDIKFCQYCGTELKKTNENNAVDEKKKNDIQRGLVDKVADKALEKVTGKRTIGKSVEEMVTLLEEMIVRELRPIDLQELKKTVKGSLILISKYTSTNNRYLLQVSELHTHEPIPGRSVWIYDNEEKIYYQLAKDRWYGKFKKAALEMIERNIKEKS